jgi:hypothetical protein
MDERLAARRGAKQRIATRRRRATEHRRKVIGFSIALFAVAWALVFGQMATGNDPVLGSSQTTSASRQDANAQQAPPDPEPQPTQVVVDPVTGQAFEVPAGEAANPAAPAPAPAPDPAPVITSQS